MSVSTEALKKLKAIAKTKSFNNTGLAGTRKRIEFLTLVIEADLWSAMIDYTHYDSHGIGERTLDTCFEMYDSEKVVTAVLTKANQDDLFKSKLIHAIGVTTFEAWSKQYLTSQDVDAFELV